MCTKPSSVSFMGRIGISVILLGCLSLPVFAFASESNERVQLAAVDESTMTKKEEREAKRAKKKAEREAKRAKKKAEREAKKAKKQEAKRIAREEQKANNKAARDKKMEGYYAGLASVSPSTEFQGDPWRFQMSCGREKYFGFLFLNIDGANTMGVLKGFAKSSYRKYGVLRADGKYNSASRKLELRSSGYVEDRFGRDLPPTDINAILAEDGSYMEGSAANASNCTTFQAWKTEFDTRVNQEGLVASFQPRSRASIEQCEQYLEWYLAASEVLETPGGKVSSSAVESNLAFDMLGVAYDGLTAKDASVLQSLGQQCSGLLENTGDTKHAALLDSLRKISGQSADYAPYIFQNTVKSIGWHRNMYFATSIRDARKLLPKMVEQLNALPVNLESLKKIQADIDETDAKGGLFATLPESDRQKFLSELARVQKIVAIGIADESLAAVNWESFSASKEGILKLKTTNENMKLSYRSIMPSFGLSRIDREFDKVSLKLSRELTDKLIAKYQTVDHSLNGLREYQVAIRRVGKEYSAVLTPKHHKELLNQHMKPLLKKARTASVSKMPEWLDQQITSNRAGLAELDQIAMDFYERDIDGLKNPSEAAKVSTGVFAPFLIAKSRQIKRSECILPSGFEDMAKAFCL
ncbi:hypothetical protein [endosymbiont of Lamellibrachia barhami]|uniref:hypothetical protein n=1 Tax=endosymbiont of Lamellibrachia barhami TaxID=205975 RepID=UPI0015AAB7FF|nr:hypothetical protein [endosymbiont of Lamellibrachia barhami]